jgi:type IV pilus assembly protein PilA
MQGAYGRGEVQAATLVWREGLANWVPLAQVAPELGIALPHTAIPAPGAGPRVPAAVRKGGGVPVWLIVVIVLGGLVMFAGVLLAISIPAYQDYTARARLSEALARASGVKLAVVEYWYEHETCPTNDDEGFEPAEDYGDGKLLRAIHVQPVGDDAGRCELELELVGLDGADSEHTLAMRVDANGQWTSFTDVPGQMLPISVRAALEH